MQIGFIGVGGITRPYRKSLRSIDGAQVTAVCDVDAKRLAAVAEEEGATAYRDYRTMLAEEELDAVFVCIPPFAHESQVADCAAAGKAVFVAKPVALDIASARRTLAAIRSAGVVNQSGYMWRSSDVVAAARERIGDRKIALAIGQTLVGVPGTAWWRVRKLSGGQVLEQATHVVDLMRLFCGELATVQAFGHTGLQPELIDFEDSTVGSFLFRNGAVGTLASTNSGGIGRYSLGLAGRDLFLELNAGAGTLAGRIDGRTVEFKGQEGGMHRQVEVFVDAVRTGNQALVPTDYADAARTLAATVAFNRSLETGRPEPVEETE